MAKKEKKGKYILDNLERDPLSGELIDSDLNTKVKEWLGQWVIGASFEAHTKIDFTSPVGGVSGVYYGLSFQLGKWEYKVQKADEWIEVSPVFTQYYQLTQKQKEELEGRIKSGLASAAQAVADLELLMHDERKYREYLEYFGYKYMDDKFVETGKRDEHSLKAVFIDQVDNHAGEGISMRSIVSRWPTLIIDFQKLSDEDIDPDKVKKKLDVSKAEATVLVTKNKLYIVWKSLFEPQLKSRYARIAQLVKSREESVNQYREWLKPVIARHKLIEEGLARPDVRKMFKTSFIPTGGHATAASMIELWAWRSMIMPEFHKGGSEAIAKKPYNPYNGWTKRVLIFGDEYGLINKHPWITDKWVQEKLEEMRKEKWINDIVPYWSFFVITLQKTNIRMPTGEEIEDGVFDVNTVFMSNNALFTKLLDLKAKQEELNHYVDTLIGVPPKFESEEQKQQPDRLSGARKFLDTFSMPFQFFKQGPYERDFDERLTKYYFRANAQDRYAPIVGFIKKKIGFGT